MRCIWATACAPTGRTRPMATSSPASACRAARSTLPEVVDFFRVLDGIGFFDKPQRPVVSAEVRPVLAGEISDVSWPIPSV
jgi:hypothetical protein